ncbi:hypothetical protein V6N13_043561 [Hibiscus sabdariffa]|uniref:Bet v I/Major latex protein domain-containing protein n=1 Tax=Hibiscus sabdariffa TaxID=183260 RepID=A0ABR2RFV2_9ROSI
MASSALTGKLEADVEIKATPEQFHDMFANKPHHIVEAKVSKQVVEAIDPDKNSITFRELQGDLRKEFKSIAATLQASPKRDGSVVHWTLEYEKLHHQIEHPDTVLQLLQDISKDIDAHLTRPN